jgi:hypothetical protein
MLIISVDSAIVFREARCEARAVGGALGDPAVTVPRLGCDTGGKKDDDDCIFLLRLLDKQHRRPYADPTQLTIQQAFGLGLICAAHR